MQASSKTNQSFPFCDRLLRNAYKYVNSNVILGDTFHVKILRFLSGKPQSNLSVIGSNLRKLHFNNSGSSTTDVSITLC